MQDIRFSDCEVRTAIMRKKSGKSPGFDDILVELLKAGGDKMVSLLCSHFHGILEQGCIPLWFQGTRLCPLWKDEADARRCSNHRGIQVSNVIPSLLLCSRESLVVTWYTHGMQFRAHRRAESGPAHATGR